MAKKAIKKRRGRPPGKRSLVDSVKRSLADIKAGRYKVGTFKVDENGVKKLHWTQRRKMEREALDEVRAKLIKAVEAAPKQDGWQVVHDNAEQANLKDAEAKKAWQAAQEEKLKQMDLGMAHDPAMNKIPPSFGEVTSLLRNRLDMMKIDREGLISTLRSYAKMTRDIDIQISKIDEQIKQTEFALVELT